MDDFEAWLDPVIEALRSALPGILPASPTAKIELVKFTCHPNSVIARFTLRDRTCERRLLAKILYPDRTDGRMNRSDRMYKQEQVADEFRTLEQLHRSFPQDSAVRVVEPVAVFPDLLALVMVEHPGERLAGCMNKTKFYAMPRDKQLLLKYVGQIGEWLRRFQEITRKPEQRCDFDEFIPYCEVRLNRLSRNRPVDFPAKFVADILSWLRKSLETISAAGIPAVGRHNDFTPNNILVSGERLLVFDFAGFSYGPASIDFVRFWYYLDGFRGSPFIRSTDVNALLTAFRSGYGRPADFEDRFEMIARVACVLDKLDDIWCWQSETITWLRQPIYERLNRRLVRWLRDALGL